MTHAIRSVRLVIAALFSVFVTSLIAQSAAAQVDVPAVEPTQKGQPATQFIVDYHHQFYTNIDAAGQFDRDSVLARGAYRAELSDSVSLTTQLTYQGAFYTIGGWDSNAQGPGGPAYSWGDIHQTTLTGILGVEAGKNWDLLAALLGRTAGEGGSDFDDTLTGGGALGFLYKSSPEFQIGLLIGAVSQLEGNAALLPLPLMDWKMSDNWKLHLGAIMLDSVGYGTEVTWMPSKSVSLGLGGTYEKRRFRLDDGGNNADGIGEESSFPIYARLGWNPDPNVNLSLMGGVAFAGQVRIGSQSGRKLTNGQKSYDPAPGVGVQAQFRF